ncbi:MAG: hypothetical protein ABI895_20785 [Deltaproteobacteria bacterium]
MSIEQLIVLVVLAVAALVRAAKEAKQRTRGAREAGPRERPAEPIDPWSVEPRQVDPWPADARQVGGTPFRDAPAEHANDAPARREPPPPAPLLGSLPSTPPARRSALQTAGKAIRAARRDAVPAPPVPRPDSTDAVVGLRPGDVASLRRAIVLATVLGPPRALKSASERDARDR